MIFSNWRLGSNRDPGWFDVGDLDNIKTEFSMSTVFRLRWQLPASTKDQIYNLLHSITMGWRHKTSKIHIEQLAQILHGELHITSRFTDHAGCVHRNTQPLPGGLCNVGQWFRLEYSGKLESGVFSTTAEIYNHDTNTFVQQCKYQAAVDSKNFEFCSWSTNRVTCNHEQFGAPADHIIVHGNTNDHNVALFDIQQVCGSIGNVGILYRAELVEHRSDVNCRYNNNAGTQKIYFF